MGVVQGSQSPRLALVVAVFTTEAQSHGETLNLQDPVNVRFLPGSWVSLSLCVSVLRGENPNLSHYPGAGCDLKTMVCIYNAAPGIAGSF
jgi:hypothetical protein